MPAQIESGVHYGGRAPQGNVRTPVRTMTFQLNLSTQTLRRFAVAAFVTAGIWSPSVRAAVQPPSTQQTEPPASTRPAGEPLQWFYGERYRLTPTDVIELTFPYVPEFDQTLTVHPDGYVTLKAVGELRVQGRTLPELRALLVEKYAPVLRDPVITIVLKEFEKPYYVAAGEVNKPGKFELRGATSVTQAVAMAGGLTETGKASEVIIFRRFSEDMLEVKKVNVQKMFSRRDLSEDPLLRPGDTLFVPRSMLSRIQRFIPLPQLSLYLNPFGMWR